MPSILRQVMVSLQQTVDEMPCARSSHWNFREVGREGRKEGRGGRRLGTVDPPKARGGHRRGHLAVDPVETRSGPTPPSEPSSGGREHAEL